MAAKKKSMRRPKPHVLRGWKPHVFCPALEVHCRHAKTSLLVATTYLLGFYLE
jgi:hypothetical protein